MSILSLTFKKLEVIRDCAVELINKFLRVEIIGGLDSCSLTCGLLMGATFSATAGILGLSDTKCSLTGNC